MPSSRSCAAGGDRVVEPGPAPGDRAERSRLRDEERHAVALMVEPPEPGDEVRRRGRHADAQPSRRIAQDALLRVHRVEVHADHGQIDRMLAEPGEIGLRGALLDQPTAQRMPLPDPPADEIERQEHDLLPPARLVLERGIGRVEQIGRVDMGRHDLAIDRAQSFDGAHDAAADAEHDGDETGPAAQERRPPAEPAAIPGRDARLVQRRVPEDAPLEALGESAGVFGDEFGIGGIADRRPRSMAAIRNGQDRRSARRRARAGARGCDRRSPNPSGPAPAGCDATARRSARRRRRARPRGRYPRASARNGR